jgi:hypothetical protein
MGFGSCWCHCRYTVESPCTPIFADQKFLRSQFFTTVDPSSRNSTHDAYSLHLVNSCSSAPVFLGFCLQPILFTSRRGNAHHVVSHVLGTLNALDLVVPTALCPGLTNSSDTHPAALPTLTNSRCPVCLHDQRSTLDPVAL